MNLLYYSFTHTPFEPQKWTFVTKIDKKNKSGITSVFDMNLLFIK